MYILILILPLMGFFLAGLFGRIFGRSGSALMSCWCLFLTWILSLYMFIEVCLSDAVVYIELNKWVLISCYDITFGLLYDTLSVSMILVVATISSLVHLYSVGYMSHDPHLSRFMSYLSLFTFFMLILVTASNFVQLFIGWEGVGLCSYLLINFWFTRILANKAALKAMIMNRIADVFFIIAILLILLTFKTTDYVIVFSLLPFMVNKVYVFAAYEFYVLTLIAFFLFIGAIGKSAQIGLHTWLPDAMEGPTPVSSLLHAATMVTAGVFLILRCCSIFEFTPNILFLFVIFGGLTALFAGLVAVFQYDLKKIIAYSTCSQLGYMFFACGLSNYHIAFFHLFNHAFFKALLFLSAGAVIHALFDEQDMRKMGRLRKILPFTYICFLIGSLAIMGFPFLTGFYSKELILEFAYSRFIVDATFIYCCGLIAALLTSIYSVRLIFFVFSENKSTNMFRIWCVSLTKSQHEVVGPMFVSMFVLCLASIFTGYFFSDMMSGNGTVFWNSLIVVMPLHFTAIDTEFIHPFVKNLPVLLSLCGMFVTWCTVFYARTMAINFFTTHILYVRVLYPLWTFVATFAYHAGFFNTIYNIVFIKMLNVSYISANKFLDKGIFEYFGPFGVYKAARALHYRLKADNNIYFNVFFMFLAVVLIIFMSLVLINIVYLPIIKHLGLLVVYLIVTLSLNKVV